MEGRAALASPALLVSGGEPASPSLLGGDCVQKSKWTMCRGHLYSVVGNVTFTLSHAVLPDKVGCLLRSVDDAVFHVLQPLLQNPCQRLLLYSEGSSVRTRTWCLTDLLSVSCVCWEVVVAVIAWLAAAGGMGGARLVTSGVISAFCLFSASLRSLK
jgi:hypothetical protein